MASFDASNETQPLEGDDSTLGDTGDGIGGDSEVSSGFYSNPRVDAMGVSWKDAMDLVSRAVSAQTPQLDVTVSEPQTTKKMMNSYVTYSVFTKQFGYVIRRRYSDFQWLRSTLMQRYTGMLIPPLPPRGADSMSTAADSSTKQDSKFVQRRMRALAKFLSEVVANPFLRGDASVIQFLSNQVEKDFEKAKATTSQTNMFSDSYIGCVAWRDYVLYNPAPDNMDRVVLDIRKQLDFLEKCYTSLLASTKRFAIKAGEYSKEIALLKDSFGQVLTQEIIMSDSTKVEAANPYGQELTATISILKRSLESWCGVTSQQPDVFENIVRPTLEYHLYQIIAFRELLDYRELAKRGLISAQKNLESHRRMQDQGKEVAKSMFGKSKPIHDCITDGETDVKGKTTFLAVLSNALNWSEIFRFNEIRHLQFKEMVFLLSSAEKNINSGLMDMWISALNIQGSEMDGAYEQIKSLVPNLAKTVDPFSSGDDVSRLSAALSRTSMSNRESV